MNEEEFQLRQRNKELKYAIIALALILLGLIYVGMKNSEKYECREYVNEDGYNEEICFKTRLIYSDY